MKKKIAVIGSSGFVGSAICRALEKSNDYSIVKVIRGDDIAQKIAPVDIVIHSANPSKRFWAEKNPNQDFIESVEKTRLIVNLSTNKKLVLISSISARTQLNHPYGMNRRGCELLVDEQKDLIIRLGPMYGEGKCLGALGDILANNPVYVSEETKYAYIDVNLNAQIIISLLAETGLKEVGAQNGIKLKDLRDAIGSRSTFSGFDDTQIPINPEDRFPDARDVIDYVKGLK